MKQIMKTIYIHTDFTMKLIAFHIYITLLYLKVEIINHLHMYIYIYIYIKCNRIYVTNAILKKNLHT